MRHLDRPASMHQPEFIAAYEAAGDCCHPDCDRRWGTGCWHCHSPHYSDRESIAAALEPRTEAR